MTTAANRPPARTLPLQGTSKNAVAYLDFASVAALHYAPPWAVNPPLETRLADSVEDMTRTPKRRLIGMHRGLAP